MFLILSCLFASSALAHYPHDVAAWVAVSPGPTPAWVITSLWRGEAWMVARTQNDADVEVRFVMHGAEYIETAALVSDSRLLLGGEELGLWVSEDAGETFSLHPDIPVDATLYQIAVSPTVDSDGIVLICGRDGIWRSEDGGDSFSQATTISDAGVLDLDLSVSFTEDGTACAIDTLGRVSCSQSWGVEWSQVGVVDDRPWAISVDSPDRIFVGGEGGLWRSADAGESWTPIGMSGRDVTAVEALGDGVVLAAGLYDAVQRSTDGGETWSLHSDHLEEVSSAQGGPRAGEHYFDFLQAGNDSVYLASWEGLVRSDDLGLTWSRIHTCRQDIIRGVDLAYVSPGELWAFLGSYGGGVQLVDLDEPTGELLSVDDQVLYLRNVEAPPDFYEHGVAMFSGRSEVHVTDDWGATWAQAGAESVVHAQKLGATPNYGEDPLLLVGGMVDGGGEFYVSTDHGATWIQASKDEPCEGFGSAVFVSWDWADDSLAWASCEVDGAVYQTSDHGASFTKLGQVDTEIFTLAATPGGEQLFAGATNGLYRYEPGGDFELLAFGGYQVQALGISPAWSDDSTIYAILAAGGWYQSTDGGESWSELPAPTGSYPLHMSLSPDFASDDTIAVAAYDGGWASFDRGQSWRWLNLLEHIQETGPEWIFEGDWQQDFFDGASGGRLAYTGTAGDRAELLFRGVAVQLYSATTTESGEVEISLDGGTAERVSLQGDGEAKVLVWSASGLEDAWHTVSVTVTEPNATIDEARIWRRTEADGPDDTGPDDSDPPDSPPTDSDAPDSGPGDSEAKTPGDRCNGCNAAPAGAALLLAVLVPVGIRWRRD